MIIEPIDENDKRLPCPDARKINENLYSCPTKDCAGKCPYTSDEDVERYKCLVI